MIYIVFHQISFQIILLQNWNDMLPTTHLTLMIVNSLFIIISSILNNKYLWNKKLRRNKPKFKMTIRKWFLIIYKNFDNAAFSRFTFSIMILMKSRSKIIYLVLRNYTSYWVYNFSCLALFKSSYFWKVK